jgi:hypothetical protein
MRDIILGRKVGTANTVRARRAEKRMVEACERRILEFPLAMDAREIAKELKREGWYAQIMKVLFSGLSACGQEWETEQCVWFIPIALSGCRRSAHQWDKDDFDLALRSLRVFLQRLRQSQEPPASNGRKTPTAPTA